MFGQTQTSETALPDGAADLHIHLSPHEVSAIGPDARSMLADLNTAIRALVEIRAGDWDKVVSSPHDEGNPGALQRQRMDTTIYNLECHLIPQLEAIRTTALRAYRAHGASYADLAAAMGLSARSTAQSRWEKLAAGTISRWEKWARGKSATETGPTPARPVSARTSQRWRTRRSTRPIGDPLVYEATKAAIGAGIEALAAMFPGNRQEVAEILAELHREITPEGQTSDVTYTHPDVFTAPARGEKWADPETDPTRLDWTTRQATAAIPFDVIDGRPVNPHGPTGIRYGRNELGHWGEQLAADAVVTLTDVHGRRWLVMVERSDGHGWALPGGYVDPGEDAGRAAIRELAEETGLTLENALWEVLPARYVPDPRASDESWMVTVPARAHLGTVREFPGLVGSSDAKRAMWVQADDYPGLVAYLKETYAGKPFAAHVPMLTELFSGTL